MDGCTCMHAYIHACMCATCMHACIHACMYTHTHTHTHTHTSMYVCMHGCMCASLYVCVYVCTYVRMYGLSSRTQQNTNRMCSLTVECVLLLAVERKQNVFSYRRTFSLTSSRTQQNTTEHTCNARAQTVSFCLCMSLSLSRAWAQQQYTRRRVFFPPPSLPFPSLPSLRLVDTTGRCQRPLPHPQPSLCAARRFAGKRANLAVGAAVNVVRVLTRAADLQLNVAPLLLAAHAAHVRCA